MAVISACKLAWKDLADIQTAFIQIALLLCQDPASQRAYGYGLACITTQAGGQA
jgi:hypothetical protein